MEKEIQQQVTLSHKEAFKISFKNIRIRLGRSIISTAGIFFAIAFLTANLSFFSINSNLLRYGPEIIKDVLEKTQISISERTWIIILSLIVAVVGIMNSMLMAVMERSKEIGTMKCLGALDRFIVELFLLESGLQGLIGSLAGTLIGLIFTLFFYIINYGGEVIKYLSYPKLLLYGIISIFLGLILSVIGAVYPAYRSAKLEPAEALRREV